MPQRRAPRPADPEVVADRLHSTVRQGTPDTARHLSTTEQINRLGVDEVRRVAEQTGAPRSKATIRRWRRTGRIPNSVVAQMVQRADQVHRAGGREQAAQRWGRAPRTINTWLTRPEYEVKQDARQRIADMDRADRRAAAGVPVGHSGQPKRLPKLNAEGDVWVKGSTVSETYEAHRKITDMLLDEETTAQLLDVLDSGDPENTREFVEEFLSFNLAGCAEYGADTGWHFTDLVSFRIDWS